MNFHIEHARKSKVAVPCTAHHMTFEGKCLNCGYDPAGDLDKLKKLVDTSKKKLIAEVAKKGIYENFGGRELREIDEAATQIVHSSRHCPTDRKIAGQIAMSFWDWASRYNG